jgi:hypothetical protein
MPHLENHYSDAEEGVRTMVAECMGSLIWMQPSVVLKKLSQMVSSHSTIEALNGTLDTAVTESKNNALVCWTVATSIKPSITGKADQSQLDNYMPLGQLSTAALPCSISSTSTIDANSYRSYLIEDILYSNVGDCVFFCKLHWITPILHPTPAST